MAEKVLLLRDPENRWHEGWYSGFILWNPDQDSCRTGFSNPKESLEGKALVVGVIFLDRGF